MIVVILSEKNQGIPSSGIQFCFWGALVIYAGIKLRSLILISRDQVCIIMHVHTGRCQNYALLVINLIIQLLYKELFYMQSINA